jgi:hypothetical protein
LKLLQHLHNSRHRFLVKIFGVFIIFIGASRVHIEAESSAKALSDERRRAYCEKLIEVLPARSVIVRVKKCHQHLVHVVY